MPVTSVTIEQLPTTLEAFIAQRDGLATTPEGGAAIMVVALWLYAEEEALGRPCLTLAVDSALLQAGAGGYQGRELRPRGLTLIRTQLRERKHVPRSYIKGATPANGYALPPAPYTIEASRNPYSGNEDTGQVKVFVTCSGADSPRPVTLRRDDHGVWKAYEWSSLLSGVRPPGV
jgi:hypothetical protein